MTPTPEQIHAAATAIANARGMRRGAPQTVNILDVLPPNFRSEVLQEGEAAAKAVLQLVTTPTRTPLFPEEVAGA